MAADGGFEVIVGGEFPPAVATVTVKSWVAIPPRPSFTLTSTAFPPNSPGVGVHEIKPAALIVIPLGATASVNVKGSPSGSVALTCDR